jgi:endonuclease YncB( thermonuclease family)
MTAVLAMLFVTVGSLTYAYVVPAILAADIPGVISSGVNDASKQTDGINTVFANTTQELQNAHKSGQTAKPADISKDTVDVADTPTTKQSTTKTTFVSPPTTTVAEEEEDKALDLLQRLYLKQNVSASEEDDEEDTTLDLLQRLYLKQNVSASEEDDEEDTILDGLSYGDVTSGSITKVVDGDTLDIDGIRIRLALVNTPERGESGYADATAFTNKLCPVGTIALYDEDEGQKKGSYERTIAKVWCMGYPVQAPKASLNSQLVYGGHAEILPKFCKISEFGDEPWAEKNGC